MIPDVASDRGSDYIPINERMNEYLKEYSSNPTYPIRSAVNQMILSMVRHFVFGKDWKSISRDSGQVLHVDHIHLSEDGAQIIAESISSYLSKHPI